MPNELRANIVDEFRRIPPLSFGSSCGQPTNQICELSCFVCSLMAVARERIRKPSFVRPEDRRRWAAIIAEASVGIHQRRLGVTGFD